MTNFLILGGGSAGCVLAARLTEDSRHNVTLVEAGRDLTAETMSPTIRSRYPGRAYLDPGNIWSKLTAFIGAPEGKTEGRAARLYEQGRVLGGGSAVNAMVANRGAPGDYDEWGAEGAEGWSWDACLPYFRKLEHDFDFGGPFHGKDGPISVRRISEAAMSPFVKAVSNTFAAQGHVAKPDQNGEWSDGIYTSAIAVTREGERIPTSVAYLSPEVRRRANLRIITDRLVDRILFDGSRATGAVTRPAAGGDAETLSAEEVIVSTGAIHTAALLLRSGVGPAQALGALGIPVVLDRAGVGRNLMEHPSTAVSTFLPPAARLRDLGEHHDHAILRFSSGLGGAPEGDMHAAIIARSGWHFVGQRVGTLFLWVNKAYSRGTVELASRDPQDEPKVDFRMLSDARDMERLKYGFRLCARTLTHPLMKGWADTAFPTSYSPRVAKLAGAGFVTAAQRGLFGALLDYAGPFRSALIHGAVTLGTRLDDLLKDDAALTGFLGAAVGGVWHASGTCRMGRAADPLAVTDGQGRVHGLEGLRICDASLMPTIPRANTNIPTIMVAERIADLIKSRAG
jgi:5-(hydroxymethyl)furfural/furfural oxidase